MVKSKPSMSASSRSDAQRAAIQDQIAALDERISRIDADIERFAVGSMSEAFNDEMRDYYNIGDGEKELGPGVFSGGLDRVGFEKQAMIHMNSNVLGGLRGRLVTERMRLRRQLRELG